LRRIQKYEVEDCLDGSAFVLFKKVRLIFIVILIISIVLYPKIIETNIKVRAIIPIIQYNIEVIEVPIINTRTVRASAYNPVESQCDSTPDRMAWNDKITHQNKNKVIAVSRDLLSFLPRGTEIYFNHRAVIHKKIVLDKMGRYARKGGPKRFKIVNSIDILTDNYRTARKFGIKKKKIYWFGGIEKLYSIKIHGGYIMLDGNVSDVLNYKVLELGPTHTKVETEDGKILYLSRRKPRNQTMFTDKYQLTMMCMYLMSGLEDKDSVFECYYRKNPFGGGFTVALGLEAVIDYLNELHITGDNIDYLRKTCKFPDIFWEYLREFKWKGLLRGIPEGTFCQPYVPIVQVTAKLPIANFIETKIINLIGNPTITGTKAMRMTLSNPDVPWVEMSARRSGSYDDGMIIARSSYICGSSGTSLVSAGEKYEIPLIGTMAHSAVQAMGQLESFSTHSDLLGEYGVFLIDTYNSIHGINDVIKVAKEKGLNKFGCRIDSDHPTLGDLSEQSKIVRKILNDNGFPDARILLSSDIDENIRRYLKGSGAKNDCDGVGTSLVCRPLGIVYKIVEIGNESVIKKSNPTKTTDPGAKVIYRLIKDGKVIGYVAYHTSEQVYSGMYHHRSDRYTKTLINNYSETMKEQILVDVLVDNMNIIPMDDINTIRDRVLNQEVPMLLNDLNPEYTLRNSFNESKMTELPLYLSNILWKSKESLMKNKEQ